MDKQVAPDDADGVPGSDPATQFALRAEKRPVFHPEFPRQDGIFRFGVAQVVGKHHGLMVAQEHGNPAAGLLRFLLEFVEQPENLHHILTPVEDIPDHDQVVPAEIPSQVLVNHVIALKQANHAVQPSVGVGHDENLVGLTVIPPGFPADFTQLHLEGVSAAMVGHLQGLRLSGDGPVLDGAGRVDRNHPRAGLRIQDVRSVDGQRIPPGLRSGG